MSCRIISTSGRFLKSSRHMPSHLLSVSATVSNAEGGSRIPNEPPGGLFRMVCDSLAPVQVVLHASEKLTLPFRMILDLAAQPVDVDFHAPPFAFPHLDFRAT